MKCHEKASLVEVCTIKESILCHTEKVEALIKILCIMKCIMVCWVSGGKKRSALVLDICCYHEYLPKEL